MNIEKIAEKTIPNWVFGNEWLTKHWYKEKESYMFQDVSKEGRKEPNV